jgi:hypothetical protein
LRFLSGASAARRANTDRAGRPARSGLAIRHDPRPAIARAFHHCRKGAAGQCATTRRHLKSAADAWQRMQWMGCRSCGCWEAKRLPEAWGMLGSQKRQGIKSIKELLEKYCDGGGLSRKVRLGGALILRCAFARQRCLGWRFCEVLTGGLASAKQVDTENQNQQRSQPPHRPATQCSTNPGEAFDAAGMGNASWGCGSGSPVREATWPGGCCSAQRACRLAQHRARRFAHADVRWAAHIGPFATGWCGGTPIAMGGHAAVGTAPAPGVFFPGGFHEDASMGTSHGSPHRVAQGGASGL